jgi:hypothetical protein
MAPLARLVHTLPGRKRIRISEKRGDEAYFARLKKSLADCPGVVEVETNPATASVLVHHAANVTHFLHSAVKQELFRLTRDNRPIRTGANPPVPANRGTADKSAPSFRLSTNMRRLIFLGLIGMGIRQTSKGNIAVPAVTAFMDAIKILWLGKE